MPWIISKQLVSNKLGAISCLSEMLLKVRAYEKGLPTALT